MNLYVGQKIKSVTGDLVKIVDIQGQMVKLLYKGQIFTLNKFLLYKINKNLFIVNDEDIENNENINASYTNYKVCKNCSNCMNMKNGTCFGSTYTDYICGDYRYSPEISKEELDRWPKIGDALYFKFHKPF